jgi:integrase
MHQAAQDRCRPAGGQALRRCDRGTHQAAAIIDRADVLTIRLHDLRHTHATLLLAAGTPIKAVSERLGHAKTSITLDTYAHVLPDMQDRAVEAIDAALVRATI